MMVVQITVIRIATDDAIVRFVLPATIALAPLALWSYRRFVGVWVMYVGLSANLAAILANGGLMPIEHRTVVAAVGAEQAAQYRTGEWLRGSKDVLVAPGQGRLVPLGDGILVRAGSRGFAASPGDLVIWTGLALAGAQASVEWHRKNRGVRAQSHAPATAEGGAPLA